MTETAVTLSVEERLERAERENRMLRYITGHGLAVTFTENGNPAFRHGAGTTVIPWGLLDAIIERPEVLGYLINQVSEQKVAHMRRTAELAKASAKAEAKRK